MNPWLILLLCLSIPVGLLLWPVWRRRRALRAPFPEQWHLLLHSKLPVYSRLPPELQQRLQRHIKLFLSRISMEGCAGQEIDDEVRLTIAGSACLLLLGGEGPIYPQLRSVLVYPAAFIARRQEMDEGGVVSDHSHDLLGESWDNGRVILAWDHSQRGVHDFSDGVNVVLHEFAHQLDSESGSVNGAPILPDSRQYQRFAEVLEAEFRQLQEDERQRRETLLDPYGATNPAEFFAVATESFFELPMEMARWHPELFEQLRACYRLDPREWVAHD